MYQISKKVTRTGQPQQATPIDWSNPIARGIVFALPFGNREAANGKTGTASGTVAQGVTSRGLAVKLNGSSYLDFGSTPFIDPTGPFTISLYEETITAQSYSTLLSLPCGANQLTWLRGSSAGYYCAVGKTNGTVAAFAGTGAQTTGEKKRFILTGTALNNYATYRLWMDGVELSRTTQSFGALTTGNTKIGQDGLDNPFNGNIADVTFWNRALTDSEVASINANPWQIFEKINRSIFIPISASTPTDSIVGIFDQSVATNGFFDNTVQQVGWFDSDLMTVTAAAPPSGAYTLTAQAGTYNLTGAAAALRKSKLLTASGGTYTLNGQQATIKRSKLITASGGSYSLGGASATILKSKVIAASGGSYSMTGATATVLRSRLLTASGGTYSITGQQVTITYGASAAAYLLTAQGGSYSLNGQQATLLRSKRLVASGGIYSYVGQQVTISRSRYLSASGGSYVYNGSDAILSRTRKLVASGGSYLVSGQDVVITYQLGGGYPSPADVLLGVMYGPTGTEYTGTLDIGKKFRFDIATGNLVMILDGKKVMSL
jgi:hypothetical protein